MPAKVIFSFLQNFTVKCSVSNHSVTIYDCGTGRKESTREFTAATCFDTGKIVIKVYRKRSIHSMLEWLAVLPALLDWVRFDSYSAAECWKDTILKTADKRLS